MTEIYTGAKFKTKKLGDLQDSEEKVEHALKISKLLSSLPEDWFSESAGNVSFKTTDGMMISSSGADLRQLHYPQDFCEIVSSSHERRIQFYGSRLPSSETKMHLLIFENRPDKKYCFHVHLPNIEKLQLFSRFPTTRQFLSYGTIDLAKEASNFLRTSDIVILRDHGIILIGNNFAKIVEDVQKASKL